MIRFVSEGNRAWAINQLNTGLMEEQIEATEDVVDTLNMIVDPFNF